MKQLRSEYLEHLESGVTQLVHCVRIERKDGEVLRFTDADSTLTMSNGAVYRPDAGAVPSSATTEEGNLDSGTLDLEGVLTANGIRREDIAGGRFDHAAVYLFRTRADDPVEDDEPLGKGFWGQAELRGDRLVTEWRSLASILDRRLGRVHGPTCDADLGDSRCKVDLAALAVTGTITSVDGQTSLTDSDRDEEEDWFGAGTVHMTSGDNEGIAREVESFADGEFTLWEPFPYPLAVGDSYEARPGCRKRFGPDCGEKFDNQINFQGFPHLPGQGAVTRWGGQR